MLNSPNNRQHIKKNKYEHSLTLEELYNESPWTTHKKNKYEHPLTFK